METRKKRLADRLRTRLGAIATAKLSDNQVLRATEGTLFRASIELGIAIEDLKAAFMREGRKWADKFTRRQ